MLFLVDNAALVTAPKKARPQGLVLGGDFLALVGRLTNKWLMVVGQAISNGREKEGESTPR